MRPEIEKITLERVSVGAVVMALKRYGGKEVSLGVDLEDFVARIGDVTLVSDLVEFTYTDIKDGAVKQQRLMSLSSGDSRSLLSCVKGVYELTIVVKSRYEKEVEEIFEGDELVSKIGGMSAVMVQLPRRNEEVRGLYYYIFRQLAWEGVVVSEVVSTQNELIFLVRDEFVERAFGVVKGLRG
jgi:hypothetical protein